MSWSERVSGFRRANCHTLFVPWWCDLSHANRQSKRKQTYVRTFTCTERSFVLGSHHSEHSFPRGGKRDGTCISTTPSTDAWAGTARTGAQTQARSAVRRAGSPLSCCLFAASFGRIGRTCHVCGRCMVARRYGHRFGQLPNRCLARGDHGAGRFLSSRPAPNLDSSPRRHSLEYCPGDQADRRHSTDPHAFDQGVPRQAAGRRAEHHRPRCEVIAQRSWCSARSLRRLSAPRRLAVLTG
jgi:NAD-dependent dihydropyrimidine dehydrogenase PreA subunit